MASTTFAAVSSMTEATFSLLGVSLDMTLISRERRRVLAIFEEARGAKTEQTYGIAIWSFDSQREFLDIPACYRA
jgi:hypothetical protein